MNSSQRADILLNLKKQISSFFSFELSDEELISLNLVNAIARSENCYGMIKNKYYTSFNPLHSGQYAMFLYFLSNEIYTHQGNNTASDKIYYLNKIMHSLDLYYEIKMPEIFFWEHPLGTILGRGKYSNYFTIYQGCTIGGSVDSNGDAHYPEMEEHVTLFSHSCVLGKCRIGANTIISSHAYVINTDIPANSIVFGQGRDLIIKPNKRETIFFHKK